jgi:hypothetical protein
MKWIISSKKIQFVDSEKLNTIRWLQKTKGRRKAFEIGNELAKINHWMMLKELNNNVTILYNYLENHIQITPEPKELKEKMIVHKIYEIEKKILYLTIENAAEEHISLEKILDLLLKPDEAESHQDIRSGLRNDKKISMKDRKFAKISCGLTAICKNRCLRRTFYSRIKTKKLMKKLIKFSIRFENKNDKYLTRRKKMKKFDRRKTFELIVSKEKSCLERQFNDACIISVINYGLTVHWRIRNLDKLFQRKVIFGKLFRVHNYDYSNRATVRFEESVGNKVKKTRSSGTIRSLKENLLKWLKYKYRKMDADNFDEFLLASKGIDDAKSLITMFNKSFTTKVDADWDKDIKFV